MGNNSILTVKEHVMDLILQAKSYEDSEHVHALCHALEALTQMEHMVIAIRGIKGEEPDFPSSLDFD
jgi:hypothetical protein